MTRLERIQRLAEHDAYWAGYLAGLTDRHEITTRNATQRHEGDD